MDLPTQRLNLSSVVSASSAVNLSLMASFPASPLCRRCSAILVQRRRSVRDGAVRAQTIAGKSALTRIYVSPVSTLDLERRSWRR